MDTKTLSFFSGVFIGAFILICATMLSARDSRYTKKDFERIRERFNGK
jgi:hypothetical protein